jgi:uncharacterized membrane protein YtjA (UPF0391 family)
MRKWAGLFFIIALGAAALGIVVVAVSDTAIANLLFAMLLVIAALFLLSTAIALFMGRTKSVTRVTSPGTLLRDR